MSSGKFHMSYGLLNLYQISIPDLWHFAASMNLLYADKTSSNMLNLIFATHMHPKDIFGDFLHCCVESFDTMFG